jgi:SHS2 domain-containing protein
MKEFEILEHTADIGIAAYGKNKREVFVNAAKGMYHIITEDKREFKENFSHHIKLKAENLENLLVAWLSELLYLSETKLVVFNRFEIEELSDYQLSGKVFGKRINQSGHKIKREIKAVTYHRLEVKEDKENGIWRAQVIFDI